MLKYFVSCWRHITKMSESLLHSRVCTRTRTCKLSKQFFCDSLKVLQASQQECIRRNDKWFVNLHNRAILKTCKYFFFFFSSAWTKFIPILILYVFLRFSYLLSYGKTVFHCRNEHNSSLSAYRFSSSHSSGGKVSTSFRYFFLGSFSHTKEVIGQLGWVKNTKKIVIVKMF